MTKGKIISRGTALAGRRSKRAGEPRESGLHRERKRGTLYPDISRHSEREGESDSPGACTACDPVPDGSQPGCLLSDGGGQEKGGREKMAYLGKDSVFARRAGRRPGRAAGDALFPP